MSASLGSLACASHAGACVKCTGSATTGCGFHAGFSRSLFGGLDRLVTVLHFCCTSVAGRVSRHTLQGSGCIRVVRQASQGQLGPRTRASDPLCNGGMFMISRPNRSWFHRHNVLLGGRICVAGASLQMGVLAYIWQQVHSKLVAHEACCRSAAFCAASCSTACSDSPESGGHRFSACSAQPDKQAAA